MEGRPSRDFWAARTVAVTGGAGFLGRPTVRMLGELGANVRTIRSAEFDLRCPDAAQAAFDGCDTVLHLAANVGGIGYNARNPAPLIYDNLMMGANVFEAARSGDVERLLAACSVCAYPYDTPVPFRESDIWDGYPEVSNAPYGIAKKVMIVLSDAYRRQYGFESCVPVIANLYGPGDNFDLEDSHVIPALVRKFCEAVDGGKSTVTLWGTGRPSREFLYVDDAARGLLLCAEHLQSSEPVNLGVGGGIRIAELAEEIARAAGFEGEIVWDESRPDGQMKRSLDVTKAREMAGFQAEIDLETGVRETVEWYREHGQPRLVAGA